MLRRPVESVSTSSNASTRDLLRALLEPLVRLLVKTGFSVEQIREIVDEVSTAPSVDVVSRQAVCLGAQQRDCMDLLFRWRRDTDFMTPNGVPASLPMDGPICSFRSLCAKAAVVHSAELLLDTLLRFEAVSVDDAGLISVTTPTLMLGPPDAACALATDGILRQLAGFVRVIEHNVVHATRRSAARFERSCAVVVAEELIPVANRVARERGQEFIDGIDEWLERQRGVASPSNRYVEIGVGAYLVDLGQHIGV